MRTLARSSELAYCRRKTCIFDSPWGMSRSRMFTNSRTRAVKTSEASTMRLLVRSSVMIRMVTADGWGLRAAWSSWKTSDDALVSEATACLSGMIGSARPRPTRREPR